jgi:hypothetical protein
MRLEEAITMRVLGQVFCTLDQKERAEKELQASLDALRALNSRYEVGQTLHQLGVLYLEQEQHAQAEAILDSAAAIFKALGARLDLADVRSLRTPPSQQDGDQDR